MSILKAIILLGGLGLLFGAILAYASKKFAVEVDEREEKAKEQNADGDYTDNSVSWRFVCVCNPRFTKDCIAEGKRESSGTF